MSETIQQVTETEIVLAEAVFLVEKLKSDEVARLNTLNKEAKEIAKITISDKNTLTVVHDMRIKLQKERTGIEKARKKFTDPLEAKKKEAIATEKELIAIIENTEMELEAKEKVYAAELEKIKKQKEEEEAKVLQDRIEKLNAIEAQYLVGEVSKMSDEGFIFFYDMHKKRYDQIVADREAEAKRKQEEEEAAEKKRQEEAEELRKQKEENDRVAEENRKEAERIKTENDRVAAEQQKKAQELADKEKAIQDKEAADKHAQEIKEAEEKARDDEKKRIEAEKKQKEDEEKARQEFIEKEKRYLAWLEENGVNDETRSQFTTAVSKEKVVLFKQVSVFWIDGEPTSTPAE